MMKKIINIFSLDAKLFLKLSANSLCLSNNNSETLPIRPEIKSHQILYSVSFSLAIRKLDMFDFELGFL